MNPVGTSGKGQAQLIGQEDKFSELQFHDFNDHDDEDEIATLKTTENIGDYPENSNSNEETEGLLTEKEKEVSNSFWNFSYYQSFFDVNTDQVLSRMLWSVMPLPCQATFLERQIRPPDLYGPFWITTTLIITASISANIADFIMSEGRNKKNWHWDFHKISLAATTIYSYAFILPLVIWLIMRYKQTLTQYTFLEILCIYGYSLFVFIPVSMLWVIQVTWLQLLFLIIGASLSGIVLLQTFFPVMQSENKKVGAVILGLILLFHVLLVVGFMAYFFQPFTGSNKNVIPSIQPLNATISSAINLLNNSMVNKDFSTHSIVTKNFTLVSDSVKAINSTRD